MKTLPPPFFDASAVLLSGLCLLHCLALPLLAAALPLFGIWAQAEWVHGLFVMLALPLAGLALWRAQRQRPLPWPLWAMAALGLCGLLAGASGFPSAQAETPATVAGSLLLASAHLWNWRRNGHRHG
ncbi:MerC family mercury resistance protein [Xanthomonas sp. NCPPB 2654]|uniref:MerC family mercury resistance protein n=1 Tax=unclassified Xanthomonas TaxID=2643310 RepID=UPI0021E0397D|nr:MULTISPECIES: MerC family mercury resistance protein [unclassified Xanthomonas]MDL5368146.1 MerC family mercury resistance protein [Xanthomonas sp. NCPPB 2654]UYC21015.1 MerC family mercury resistance protein [Xanthomonas sp. CFBP 8443]